MLVEQRALWITSSTGRALAPEEKREALASDQRRNLLDASFTLVKKILQKSY